MSKEKLKILLVEDDPNLGVLLVDYLESEGFEVKLCTDGELGLQAFQKYSFDLCLLDVMLPKLDGFSLAKGIRSKDKNNHFYYCKIVEGRQLRGMILVPRLHN